MRKLICVTRLGVLCMAGWLGGAWPAVGMETVSNFMVVATVQERDALPAPADGAMILLKATGNFHRRQAGTWEVLNESYVLNVKDYGAIGDGVDDTEAVTGAFLAAVRRGRKNYWAPGTILFPPGVYRLKRPITSEHHALIGLNLEGDGATIIGAGTNVPVFDVSGCPTISTRISGLSFQNFQNVVRCWTTNVNCSWTGRAVFEHCRFSSGQYVMASCATPNMYVGFSDIEIGDCNLFKGLSDSVFVDTLTGMTRDRWWSGGWCEGGGVEDGIEAAGGARFFVNNVLLSPVGVDGSPVADQSWFKLSKPGMVVLTACRFGAEYGGIPLVRNQDPATYAVSVSGVEHWTAWRPRYIFDAFPQTFSENGVFGGAGGGILGGKAQGLEGGLRGNPLRTAALSDARMRLMDDMAAPRQMASVGYENRNPMPFDPVSRTSNADDHAVFHAYGSSVNVTATNVEARFEGLIGKRYTIAEPDKFRKNEQTQFSAQLNFEALPDRLYHLTFFYRSENMKQILFDCLMPDDVAHFTKWLEISHLASPADTRGGLARATLSFYVKEPGLHQINCTGYFADASGYLEIYPIVITDGPFASPYLSGPRWAGTTGDPSAASGGGNYYSQHQTTLHFMGAAAPTNGVWRKGSLVFNNDPAPGAPVGWVCTEAGEPGVWCVFAEIGAKDER
ncbi:MAG: glycosyl hydrolase family 28-related protein [Kiritimatiellae bacterium]|nr:glycosyl hydrolase family 28-related protein [Kiritimatiellia bacterium]